MKKILGVSAVVCFAMLIQSFALARRTTITEYNRAIRETKEKMKTDSQVQFIKGFEDLGLVHAKEFKGWSPVQKDNALLFMAGMTKAINRKGQSFETAALTSCKNYIINQNQKANVAQTDVEVLARAQNLREKIKEYCRI